VFSRRTRTPAGQSLAVPGTNNETERTLRPSAEARKTGRTNKTLRGARRRTVNLCVLESLRQFLPEFTLLSIVAEVRRWTERGESCFTTLLKRLKLTVPARSVLDQLLPLPGD
jgi:transposase